MGYVRLRRAAAEIEQVQRRRRVSEKCNFKSSSISSPRGVRCSYVEAGVASLRALMAPILGSREARPTSRWTSRKGGQVARAHYEGATPRRAPRTVLLWIPVVLGRPYCAGRPPTLQCGTSRAGDRHGVVHLLCLVRRRRGEQGE